MIIDFSKKLHILDQKGYFEFFSEAGKILDNIVTNFTPEDLRQLADTVVLILNIIKNLTQPEMLNAINNALRIYGSIETENIPSYSVWRTMREINTPEMKKFMGLMILFIKNVSKNQ
ncbi:hypothetical protein ACFLSA_06155 [Bacteroidota bacterium]